MGVKSKLPKESCHKCSMIALIEGNESPRQKMLEANPKWRYCPYCGKRIKSKGNQSE